MFFNYFNYPHRFSVVFVRSCSVKQNNENNIRVETGMLLTSVFCGEDFVLCADDDTRKAKLTKKNTYEEKNVVSVLVLI